MITYMNKSALTPFTALRKERETPYKSPARAGGGHFYFHLKVDDFGFFVETCDHKKQTIHLDEHHYHGSIKRALSIYNKLSHTITWQIEWEVGKKEGLLYLQDHPDLADSLLACSNLLSPLHELVQFDPGPGNLVLNTQRETESQDQPQPQTSPPTQPQGLICKINFQPHEKQEHHTFSFLTPSLILADNTIYRIEPVIHHEQLGLFNCSIEYSEAEHLLSLFASTFPDADIQHLDYTIETHGQITPQPALLLEHVDASGALYLNVVTSAEELDLDFLNNYNLSSIAFLDEENRILQFSTLAPCDTSGPADTIEKTLKKHQDKKDPRLTYSRIDNLFILQSKLTLTFLEAELHTLLSSFILIGTEELKKFKIKMVKPQLNLNIGSGIDFLEGSADLTIDTETFELSDFLTQYETNRYIILSDGTKAIVEHRLLNRLKRLLKPDKEGKFTLSFFDLPLVADMIDEKTASKGFLTSRRILEGFNTIQDRDHPKPALTSPLRDYQHKGYNWLSYLNNHNLGGCLADDMGLGKTIQSIAMMAVIYPGEPLPSLVVMPRSILLNWQREVERFAPALTSIIYHGPGRDLAGSLKYNLILTTYTTVRNDIGKLKDHTFAYVVLDESQKIKNINSQTSKAVMLLNSRWRLALSGTPVENNLGELYALFRFLNPAMFGSQNDFRKDYFDPITRDGDEQALSDLKKKIYPFLLRRLKSEVLQELPEKTEQIVYVQMSPDQERLYEKRRQFYYEAIKMQMHSDGFNKARFFLFQAMNELRQLACIPETKSNGTVKSPKVEVLGEYLEETIGNGHKALVFANFLEALSMMEEELQKRNITYLKITGSTRNRTEIVDAFQDGDDYQVLLMTLKTGGVGLNLTAADYVYIFDPWWNASAETQAIDRVHRIGQKNSVFSYKLITRDTIEEKILQLQQNKTELVQALIESDGGGVKTLREEDIDFIFSSNRV